jgi:hypothetical protein
MRNIQPSLEWDSNRFQLCSAPLFHFPITTGILSVANTKRIVNCVRKKSKMKYITRKRNTMISKERNKYVRLSYMSSVREITSVAFGGGLTPGYVIGLPVFT